MIIILTVVPVCLVVVLIAFVYWLAMNNKSEKSKVIDTKLLEIYSLIFV